MKFDQDPALSADLPHEETHVPYPPLPIEVQPQPQAKRLVNKSYLISGGILTLLGMIIVGYAYSGGESPSNLIVVLAWPPLIVGTELLLHSFVWGARFIILVCGVIMFALGLVALSIDNSFSPYSYSGGPNGYLISGILQTIYVVFFVVGPISFLEGLIRLVLHYLRSK